MLLRRAGGIYLYEIMKLRSEDKFKFANKAANMDVDRVVSVEDDLPTFNWAGDLTVYLKPDPERKRLPPLHDKAFVFLDDLHTVEG